ncbi:hypothetical protein SBA5_780005 [Candidatus Sulfotelmatomonas gaucii]|uniref:Uncharacterized protein n=1 Tax=Candidatus Sulfuritelmatomonas gaucii TaxID=2043161 RepID=A0A2N9M4A1_9BACT|nr:hypothetical protein SBA5_780005 [Candidatus Sulfotelmatomonas gaucii]
MYFQHTPNGAGMRGTGMIFCLKGPAEDRGTVTTALRIQAVTGGPGLAVEMSVELKV